MRLIFIHDVKSGNCDNLIIDTDKKHFQYFKGTWYNPEAIKVKSKQDIDKLIDKIRNDGYALKVGNV